MESENKKIIRIPLFILAAMLESAAVAAAVKSSRTILQAVNLSTDAAGHTLTATATDGARLNRIKYDLALDAENNNKKISASASFSINLEPAAVAKISALNKENEKTLKIHGLNADAKYLYLATIEEAEKGAKLTVEDVNGVTVALATLDTIPGDYPVSENIFPKNNGAFVSFNPSFLGDLKKSAKALKAGGDFATMQAPNRKNGPYVWEYQSGIPQLSATALIVPMRNADGDYSGYDFMTSGGAAVTEYKDKIQALESRLASMEEERDDLSARLKEALQTQDKPAAANSADLDFMREKLQATEKRRECAEKLADELDAKNTLLIAECGEKAKRIDDAEKRAADLEEKYNAANATIHEKHAENIRLLNQIKELQKQLEEAKTATASAPVEKKPDGGKDPATDRQRAYIAKLGGSLPEGATIRDASILITQLKKGNAAKYSA